MERNTKEDLQCTPAMQTMYRSLLGRANRLQSRTQFQCCYKFSRCASMAASSTVGDVKALNKLARQLKSQTVKLQYWPLTRPLRILGFPDASHRNNDGGSSQRGITVFRAESRERSSKDGMTKRSPDTMRSVCRLHNSMASTKAPLQLLDSYQCAPRSFGVDSLPSSGARHRGRASSRCTHDAADRAVKAANDGFLRIEFHFVVIVAEEMAFRRPKIDSETTARQLENTNFHCRMCSPSNTPSHPISIT